MHSPITSLFVIWSSFSVGSILAWGFQFSPTRHRNQLPAVTRFPTGAPDQVTKQSFRLYSSDKELSENDVPPLRKNENDETYFELSPKRRFSVCEWQGNVKIDVREFYEKGGEMLPGKKGLSLTLKEYKIMRNLIQDGTVDDIINELEGDNQQN
jgi:hypothetical protein